MEIIKNMPCKLYLLVALAALLAGCSRSQSGMSDEQWHAVRERLTQLDDSIAMGSSHVRSIISDGMSQAADSLEYYAYFIRTANYFLYSETPDSMLPYIERTLAFCQRQESNRRLRAIEAIALEDKAAYCQLFRLPLDSVIDLRLKAYHLLRNSDIIGMVPILCGNIADTYALNSQSAEAASWYRRAIFMADSLQLEPKVQASLYMGLARVYQSLEDYDQADKNYAFAASHYDELEQGMKVFYLNSRGTFYYYQKDYQHAEEQFLALQQLLEQSGQSASFDMMLCKINLADVSMNLGKTEKARQLVDEVEPIFAYYGVTDGVYYAHSIRIGLAVRSHQLSDVPALLASENFAPPAEQGLLDIRNRYLREYYLAAGNAKLAYDNLEAEAMRNADSRVKREHALAAETMMRLGQDTLRLHHQLAMEQQRSATHAARTWVAVLIGVVAVLLLMAAFWINRNRKRRLQDELRILQLRLQSVRQRITPHFILNVIARQQDAEPTADEQELGKLTRLIRANLEVSHQPLVSLKEELYFVRYYVSVECGNDVDLSIDVPDTVSAEQLMVPSMFIQILAENAVKHGLKGYDGDKQLSIAVREQSSQYQVTVENNGRPFDIRHAQGRSTGTGLAVIRETIAIYNERHPHDVQMDFSLSTLTDGVGCRAVLLLPKDMKPII